MCFTRSVINKFRNKMAHSHKIEKPWLKTCREVKTPFNIMAIRRYDKYNIFPSSIYDICGNKLDFVKYGKKNIDGGWEVDHKLPQRLGGSNDISNLQALKSKDNAAKSDDHDFQDKENHYFWKSQNSEVDYDDNIGSLRKIKIGESYNVFENTRVKHGQIGVVISKSERYILVSFNENKPIKVYADPELFYKMKSRRCRQR